MEYATKYPGEILELACGTGRVAIPLAQDGCKVYGIDLSDSMLEQFKLKLTSEPEQVRVNIRFEKNDMTGFQLNRIFSLIIVAFRSFQALTSEESQRKFLKCVLNHLQDDGAFIINVFQPYQKMDESWVFPETLQWETTDEKTDARIIKKHRGVKIDLREQIIYPEMIYQLFKPSGEIEEVRELLKLKYYYYEQIKGLLESEGFMINEEYGYYDKSGMGQGKEMIFVCTKYV